MSKVISILNSDSSPPAPRSSETLLPQRTEDSKYHKSNSNQPTAADDTWSLAANTSYFLIGLAAVLTTFFVAQWIVPEYVFDWQNKCPNDICIKVDKQACTCDCWDGYFKGRYGRGHYKSIFYNVEKNTFLIFALMATYVSLLLKAFEKIGKLFFSGRLALIPFVVFLTCLHPCYYNVFAHFNYINDNFHSLHAHQAFFTVSETIAVLCLFLYMDKTRKVNSELPLWIMFTVSSIHIVQSLKDQGIMNVLLMKWLVGRDALFLVGDISVLLFSIFKLRIIQQLFGLVMELVRSQTTAPLKEEAAEKATSFKRNLFISLAVVAVTVITLSTVTFGG